MAVTVHRWAKWFCALCIVAAGKALFALVAGYTISQPRLYVTEKNRLLVSEILLLLVALAVFSYRFVGNPPRRRLDSVALISAVIGYLGSVLTEPSLWPLMGSVVLLGASWVFDRMSARRSEKPARI